MPAKNWPIGTRICIVLALTACSGFAYLTTNALNAQPWRDARLLPLTVVDRCLGWHAWTIWPYWLLLILGPVLALGIRTRWRFLATLRSCVVMLAINIAIWLAWPTRIVRHALPTDLDPATAAAWRLLHLLDETSNCFPSGHVAVPLVIAAGFIAEHPRAWHWLIPLLALLIPTVVTTGQHYAWDIAGGFATASVAVLIAGRSLVARHHAGRQPLASTALASIQPLVEPQDR